MNTETAPLSLNGVEIVDTFAEAFGMRAARVVVTAATEGWAQTAATVMAGYATSVISCDAEVGVERYLPADQTPDGRPGVNLLIFGFGKKSLGEAVVNRVGQCILTCPTTACYNGLDSPAEDRISVGGQLRFFGDTHQQSKKLGDRRLWRIPVMDGEFVCEDRFGTTKAVGGGNLLIVGTDQQATLQGTEAAVAAMSQVRDCMMPFPGGIVRSGSKVGSRYKKLKASTNDAYCPTLRAVADSALPENAGAVYEIVIDGLSEESIRNAMRTGLQAATASPGVIQITAGNYGGKLGPHHFPLRELL